MHRSVCRVIRGACRKVRENDCPALTAEEVRQQSNKSGKDEFIPPKHTWTEALGWTTGIVLTYEFIHRRRWLSSDLITASAGLYDNSYSKTCPFRLTTRAIAQPILSSVSNVFAVSSHKSSGIQRKSIDVTPFIHEPEPLSFKDEELDNQRRYDDAEEDDGIQFDENVSRVQHTRRTGPKDSTIASTAEIISGDIVGALGAFKFLVGNKSKKNELSMSGIELMEKGDELGSSRSLYNLGVSYDRMNESKIAREYYERAADLGHPLASYNLAVLTLQDGNLSEGLDFMKYAAENGVEEAKMAIQRFI